MGKVSRKRVLGKNRLIVPVLAAFLALTLCLPGDGGHADVGGIVRVRVEKAGGQVLYATGSGVVYAVSEEELWIVTAGHVLENGKDKTVWVEFGCAADQSGVAAAAECIGYEMAQGADLAFLRVPMKNIPGNIRARLVFPRTDKERYDALGESDAVKVQGFGGDGLIAYDGILTDFWIYVEDFAQYMMVADCALEPGMSGGGVFDEAGNLIGIACGANGDGELAAVPLHVVQAEFANVQGQYGKGE